MEHELSNTQRLTSIVALNAVSTLAQIGQFALGTTLLPIAQEVRHASPQLIGITSSILWLGMLAGLLVTNMLTRQIGYRKTVLLGLVASSISFALMPIIDWYWWPIPAAVIGFGTGLRWMANETWLYRLAPADSRGRVVGIHEALIGIATIIGPLIIVAVGAFKPTAFWLSAGIILMAAPPMFMATLVPAVDKATHDEHALTAKSELPLNQSSYQKLLFWVGFGALIAALGGLVDTGLMALLPVYMTDVGFTSTDTAWMFTILGVGAMLCQFPIGWMADHKGVVWTARLCTFFAALAVILALMFGSSLHALAIAMFILGGTAASGLLTLGLVWATQHSNGAQLTSRMRQVSITYTLLSAAGPLLAGYIVHYVGSSSLFWQVLVVVMLLGLVLFKGTPDE
ncbi:MAG: MFS transporter [Methylophilales bacterium]|nr:MFS transporter [Methylophilales bacterium]